MAVELTTDLNEIKDILDGDFSEMSRSRLAVFDSVESLPHIQLPRKNSEVVSIVCISGEVTVRYDQNTVTVNEKSMLVLLPGHLIERYSTSPDFKGFMIISSIRNFESFLPMMSRLLICSFQFSENPVVKLTDSELANQELFRDLLHRKLISPEGFFDKLVINKLCEGIFCETLNIYVRRINLKMTTQCKRSESLFFKFITEIESNFERERSVAFYADRLCVTSKHLSAVVKEISGRTAGDWIDSYVINEIKRLLSTTQMTIQEISCKLNFANQSFFGKYFKSHTGMTPRDFRTRMYGTEKSGL